MAARILAAQMPGVIHPFAAPLKKMLEALGVPAKNLYGTPAEKAEPLALLGGKSARDAMKSLGTEWGRELIATNIWVNAWVLDRPAGHVIADDVRFSNETDEIKKSQGRVIKIVRDIQDLDREATHPSENFNAIAHDVLVLNDKCPTILGRRLAAAIRVSV